MVTQAELEAAIHREIGNIATLLVSDVSGGCGQAYDVVIVSDVFKGLTTLKRHRLVNDRLRAEIAQMHAFSQKTYTVEQFNALKAAHAPTPAPGVIQDAAVPPTAVPELMLTPDNELVAMDDSQMTDSSHLNKPSRGLVRSTSISRLHYSRISTAEFWQGLQRFLESEFCTNDMDCDADGTGNRSGENEVHRLFEDIFLTQKNYLTVSEVAKIRDATGMIGMAGM
ncbi:hypothetical protein MCUN1_001515 [Malassezia cuniculi]|uniref:Bola-like protein n=1 Tax=Malassezia cuniculi TaxID=948313 RepID=A0AAF0ET70_9BASI|nr:hypothetical protein MCUN1_001515 [Malassezia cuniculi]